MADYNRLNIDPDAAQQDIRWMRQSIELLEEMRRKLQQMSIQAEPMRGQTRDAILEKVQTIIVRVGSAINNLQEAIVCIQQTVQRYEDKDAALAAQIAHGGGGRSF